MTENKQEIATLQAPPACNDLLALRARRNGGKYLYLVGF
jgi:hypothetical protein